VASLLGVFGRQQCPDMGARVVLGGASPVPPHRVAVAVAVEVVVGGNIDVNGNGDLLGHVAVAVHVNVHGHGHRHVAVSVSVDSVRGDVGAVSARWGITAAWRERLGPPVQGRERHASCSQTRPRGGGESNEH